MSLVDLVVGGLNTLGGSWVVSAMASGVVVVDSVGASSGVDCSSCSRQSSAGSESSTAWSSGSVFCTTELANLNLLASRHTSRPSVTRLAEMDEPSIRYMI